MKGVLRKTKILSDAENFYLFSPVDSSVMKLTSVHLNKFSIHRDVPDLVYKNGSRTPSLLEAVGREIAMPIKCSIELYCKSMESMKEQDVFKDNKFFEQAPREVLIKAIYHKIKNGKEKRC